MHPTDEQLRTFKRKVAAMLPDDVTECWIVYGGDMVLHALYMQGDEEHGITEADVSDAPAGA